MRSKEKKARFAASAALLIALVGCSSAREKSGAAAAPSWDERTASAMEAIRAEAGLPELELNRLAPIARATIHAQALINTMSNSQERERARTSLALELDRAMGTALTPAQVAIVHKRLLASGNQ